jgi:hypothetical protein
MSSDWRTNRDFLAGLFFLAVGAIAMWIAHDYPFGSSLRMGPGYFPTVLGGIMIAFGIAVMLAGIRNGEKIKGRVSVRALILLPVAMVVFGVLMERAGFLPALVALVLVAAAAGREFRLVEVFLLTIGLAVLSWAIFIFGLELPYPMIRGLWEY